MPRDGVSCQSLSTNDAIAVLDRELTDELIGEGYARDVVRAVQQARKQADLDVTDRIRLVVGLDDAWRAAVEPFRPYIAEQTLAAELDFDSQIAREGHFTHEARFGDVEVRVGLARAERVTAG